MKLRVENYLRSRSYEQKSRQKDYSAASLTFLFAVTNSFQFVIEINVYNLWIVCIGKLYMQYPEYFGWFLLSASLTYIWPFLWHKIFWKCPLFSDDFLLRIQTPRNAVELEKIKNISQGSIIFQTIHIYMYISVIALDLSKNILCFL